MKKRVLHLLSSKEYSGAENVAIRIIKSLEREYEFAYASPKGSIVDVLAREHIKHIPLEKIGISYLNSVFREWKPDIIHAHDFRASVKTAISPYKSIKISHLHQNPYWIKSINARSIIYSASCFEFDKVVVVSTAILEEAVFSRLIMNKTSVLSNSISIQAVLDSANESGYTGYFDVAFVGRLTNAKNPMRFIRIVDEVRKVRPEICAVMVGSGKLRSECEKLIKRLGLENNITMTGFLSNPFPVMKNSKILVITSDWEGFGMVAVEAMALGKPVIATPVGGLKTIIDSRCGRFCDSDKEFAAIINELLDNKESYYYLSDGAKMNSYRFADSKGWLDAVSALYDGP